MKQSRREHAARVKERLEGDPPSLPTIRPRALSLGHLGDRDKYRPNAAGLSNSSLCRLPLEIREHIYELALGDVGYSDHGIHLVTMRKRMAHIRCYDAPPRETNWFNPLRSIPACEHTCWGPTAGDGAYIGTHERHRIPFEWNIVSLLLTCRQVYTEAVPIMYRSNTFIVRQSAALSNLERTILPQRFQAIRTLELSTRIPASERSDPYYLDFTTWLFDDPSRWEGACRTLARMDGLRNLTVQLSQESLSSRDYHRQQQDQERALRMVAYIAPLANVPPKKFFEVKVEWPIGVEFLGALREVTGREVSELPFELLEVLEPPPPLRAGVGRHLIQAGTRVRNVGTVGV